MGTRQKKGESVISHWEEIHPGWLLSWIIGRRWSNISFWHGGRYDMDSFTAAIGARKKGNSFSCYSDQGEIKMLPSLFIFPLLCFCQSGVCLSSVSFSDTGFVLRGQLLKLNILRNKLFESLGPSSILLSRLTVNIKLVIRNELLAMICPYHWDKSINPLIRVSARKHMIWIPTNDDKLFWLSYEKETNY